MDVQTDGVHQHVRVQVQQGGPRHVGQPHLVPSHHGEHGAQADGGLCQGSFVFVKETKTVK